MTDADLIALLESKSREELTAAEVDALHQGLSRSPALRAYLEKDIRFEEYLHGYYSTVRVPVESIVEIGESRLRWRRRVSVIVGLLCLPAALGLFWYLRRSPHDDTAEPEPLVSSTEPSSDPVLGDGGSRSASAEIPAADRTSDDGSTSTAVGGVETLTPSARDLAASQRAFSKAVLDIAPRVESPDRARLAEWFAPVDPVVLQFNDEQERRTGAIGLSGLARCRLDWPVDGVLRFVVSSRSAFRWIFWRGEHGLELCYAEHARAWVAYAVERQGVGARGRAVALLASDGARARTFGHPILELRFEAGELLLSAGEHLLLRAPASGPPTEWYWDGHAVLRHFSLAPGPSVLDAEGGLRIEPRVARRSASTHEGASLGWMRAQGSDVDMGQNGKRGTYLTRGRVFEEDSLTRDGPWSGLREIALDIEDWTGAAEIFLGDAEGQPIYRVSLENAEAERRTDSAAGPVSGPSSTLRLRESGRRDVRAPDDRSEHIVPRIGRSARLLIVCAPQGPELHLRSLGDSAEAPWSTPALESTEGPPDWSRVRTLGLEVGDEEGASGSIRILRVDVRRPHWSRELSRRLLPESVRDEIEALELPRAGELSDWLRRAWLRLPAAGREEISRTLAARALFCLERGVSYGLSQSLWGLLLPVLPSCFEPGDPLLRESLIDIGHFAGSSRGGSEQERLDRRLTAALAQLHETSESERPWSDFLSDMGSTAARLRPLRLSLTTELLRRELFSHASAGRHGDLDEVLRRLIYWKDAHQRRRRDTELGKRVDKLISWVHSELPVVDGDGVRAPTTSSPSISSSRGLLADPIGKRGYNATLDIESALANGAFVEACEVVQSLEAGTLAELVPHPRVSGLAVRFDLWLRDRLDQTPKFSATLSERFDELARLRWNQARSLGELAAIETLTWRYPGSRAASEALEWLADRSLSGGGVARARVLYRRICEFGHSGPTERARARLRLVDALEGRQESGPRAVGSSGFPSVGSDAWSVEQFDGLLADLRSIRSEPTSSPPPSDESARPLGVHETLLGTRQIPHVSVEVGDGITVLGDGRNITCFDGGAGALSWSVQLPRVGERPAESWRLLPTDRGIVVSSFGSRNPVLALLDADSGAVVWRHDGTPKGSSGPREGDREDHGREDDGAWRYALTRIASHPVVDRDRLFVLSELSKAGGQRRVALRSIDLASGVELDTDWMSAEGVASGSEAAAFAAEGRVITLNDVGDTSRPALELLVDADSVFIYLEDAVVACEGSGRLRWIRRGRTLPSVERISGSAYTLGERLLARDDAVIAVFDGISGIECLDRETGTPIWSRPVAGGSSEGARLGRERLLGIVGEYLIVRRPGELEAVHLTDGVTAWRSTSIDPTAATSLLADGRLLLLQKVSRVRGAFGSRESAELTATPRERAGSSQHAPATPPDRSGSTLLAELHDAGSGRVLSRRLLRLPGDPFPRLRTFSERAGRVCFLRSASGDGTCLLESWTLPVASGSRAAMLASSLDLPLVDPGAGTHEDLFVGRALDALFSGWRLLVDEKGSRAARLELVGEELTPTLRLPVRREPLSLARRLHAPLPEGGRDPVDSPQPLRLHLRVSGELADVEDEPGEPRGESTLKVLYEDEVVWQTELRWQSRAELEEQQEFDVDLEGLRRHDPGTLFVELQGESEPPASLRWDRLEVTGGSEP